jgi:hypothetical protein
MSAFLAIQNLQTHGEGGKSPKKKDCAGRRPETKWEIPVFMGWQPANPKKIMCELPPMGI